MSEWNEVLKPCPFCGGDAEGWCSWKDYPDETWVGVKCIACNAKITGGATYDFKPYKSEAFKRAQAKWNSRINTDKGETNK